MRDTLPLDLRVAVAALAERFRACRRISPGDLNDELPARDLSREEVDALLKHLADHGLDLIEDAADDGSWPLDAPPDRL